MNRSLITQRNAHQWRAIAYFLSGFEVLASARPALSVSADDRARKRSAGAVAALSRSIPDGNHGDNKRSIK